MYTFYSVCVHLGSIVVYSTDKKDKKRFKMYTLYRVFVHSIVVYSTEKKYKKSFDNVHFISFLRTLCRHIYSCLLYREKKKKKRFIMYIFYIVPSNVHMTLRLGTEGKM